MYFIVYRSISFVKFNMQLKYTYKNKQSFLVFQKWTTFDFWKIL